MTMTESKGVLEEGGVYDVDIGGVHTSIIVVAVGEYCGKRAAVFKFCGTDGVMAVPVDGGALFRSIRRTAEVVVGGEVRAIGRILGVPKKVCVVDGTISMEHLLQPAAA